MKKIPNSRIKKIILPLGTISVIGVVLGGVLPVVLKNKDQINTKVNTTTDPLGKPNVDKKPDIDNTFVHKRTVWDSLVEKGLIHLSDAELEKLFANKSALDAMMAFVPASSRSILKQVLNNKEDFLDIIKSFRNNGVTKLSSKNLNTIGELMSKIKPIEVAEIDKVMKKFIPDTTDGNKNWKDQLFAGAKLTAEDKNILFNSSYQIIKNPLISQEKVESTNDLINLLLDSDRKEDTETKASQGHTNNYNDDTKPTIPSDKTEKITFKIMFSAKSRNEIEKIVLKKGYTSRDIEKLRELLSSIKADKDKTKAAFYKENKITAAQIDQALADLDSGLASAALKNKFYQAFHKINNFLTTKVKVNGKKIVNPQVVKIAKELKLNAIYDKDPKVKFLDVINKMDSKLKNIVENNDIIDLIYIVDSIVKNGLGTTLKNNQDVIGIIARLFNFDISDNIKNLITLVFFDGITSGAGLSDEDRIAQMTKFVVDTLNKFMDIDDIDFSGLPVNKETLLSSVAEGLVRLLLKPFADSEDTNAIEAKIREINNEILKFKQTHFFKDKINKRIEKIIKDQVTNNNTIVPSGAKGSWDELFKFYTNNIVPYLHSDSGINDILNMNQILFLHENSITDLENIAQKAKGAAGKTTVTNLINNYKNDLISIFSADKIATWTEFYNTLKTKAPSWMNLLDINKLKNIDAENMAEFLKLQIRKKLDIGVPVTYLVMSDDNSKNIDMPFNGKRYRVNKMERSNKVETFSSYLMSNIIVDNDKEINFTLKIDRVKNAGYGSAFSVSNINNKTADENMQEIDRNVSFAWTKDVVSGQEIASFNTQNNNQNKANNSTIKLKWEKNNSTGEWSIIVETSIVNTNGEDDMIYKVYDVTRDDIDTTQNLKPEEIKKIVKEINDKFEAYRVAEGFNTRDFLYYYEGKVKEIIFKKDSEHQSIIKKNKDESWNKFLAEINKYFPKDSFDINKIRDNDNTEVKKLYDQINAKYGDKQGAYWLIALNDDRDGDDGNYQTGWRNTKLYPGLTTEFAFFDSELNDNSSKGRSMLTNGIPLLSNIKLLERQGMSRVSFVFEDLRGKNGNIPNEYKDGFFDRTSTFDREDLRDYDKSNSKDDSVAKKYGNRYIVSFDPASDDFSSQEFIFTLYNKRKISWIVEWKQQSDGTWTLLLKSGAGWKGASGEDDAMFRIRDAKYQITDTTKKDEAKKAVNNISRYLQLKSMQQNNTYSRDELTTEEYNNRLAALESILLLQNNKQKIINFEREQKLTMEVIKKNGFFNGKGLIDLTENEWKVVVSGFSKMAIWLPSAIYDIIADAKTGNGIIDLVKNIANKFNLLKDILDGVKELKEITNNEYVKKLQTIDSISISRALYKILNTKIIDLDVENVEDIITTFKTLLVEFGVNIDGTQSLLDKWKTITIEDKKMLLSIIKTGFPKDGTPQENRIKLNNTIRRLLKVFDLEINSQITSILFGKDYNK